MLILSGLYGLASAGEPVQLYTCPVEIESIEVQMFWRKVDVLTRIFIEYIQNAGIKRIFDLTGRSLYRDLINWDLVKKQTDAEVLHCFSEEAAGDSVLADYGNFAGNHLFSKSEDELLSIKPNSSYETENGDYYFSTIIKPPEGYPREPMIVLPGSDSEEDAGKMREIINYKLDKFELRLKNYLKEKEAKNPDLIYALDYDHRNSADYRRKEYLKKWPKERKSDLSLFDFLEYSDYRAIIDRKWNLFKDDFGKKNLFIDNFNRIRTLRNVIKHNNPVKLSELRTGEGILIWFKDAMGEDNE